MAKAMRYLIDTHVLLWWFFDRDALSKEAQVIIADSDNDVLVSVVTPWEIFIKQQKGKLKIPDGLMEEIENEAFEILPINTKHLMPYKGLPLVHSDPFDRMIIAQTIKEELTLITRDKLILQYNVKTLKA